MKEGKFGLSSNMLKIFAMICMTLDHVAFMLLDDFQPLRIVGRLAFPIFAYFIAEGCFYTRHKLRHFLEIFLLGVFCQVVYFIAMRDWTLNILLTFSVSVGLILLLELTSKDWRFVFPLLIAAFASIFVVYLLPEVILPHSFHFDYGIFGVLLPVLVCLAPRRFEKWVFALAGIILVSHALGGIQWYSLLALIPLALYNGRRGTKRLKYMFYIFYPVHLGIIGLISFFL